MCVFTQNVFRKTSLLLNAECIVKGCHQQDLLHLVWHQIVKDVAVGILLAQEFLQQHPGIHLPGVLEAIKFFPEAIILFRFIKEFACLLAVQVVGDNAGQILHELALLLQKGPLVQLGEFFEVKNLYFPFPVVDGFKLLGLFPLSLPKSLAGIFFSLEPKPGHGHLGILPRPGQDLGNLGEGLRNAAVLLDDLGGFVDARKLLQPLFPLGNQSLNVLF